MARIAVGSRVFGNPTIKGTPKEGNSFYSTMNKSKRRSYKKYRGQGK